MTHLIEKELTESIIGAFYEVYNTLGFGFLEAREVQVRVMYKGEELSGQRIDMIVDDKVLVETKSTLEMHPAARRQLRNYLGATNIEVGLLLHFGPRATFYREIRTRGWRRCGSPEPEPEGTTRYIPSRLD